MGDDNSKAKMFLEMLKESDHTGYLAAPDLSHPLIIESILNDFYDGMNLSHLADKYRASYARIREVLRMNGFQNDLRKKMDEDVELQMIDAFKEGLTVEQVCEKFKGQHNVSFMTIYRLGVEHGKFKPLQRGPLSKHEIQNIRALLNEGCDRQEISNLIGRSLSTVDKYIKEIHEERS